MNVAAGAGAYDVVPVSASVATFLVNPSLEVKARARKQLLDSLEFIPDEVKDAFVEAMIKVPHLVELESNPDHHLEFTRYDPWKAALRLANYWKTRLHVFGKERAFLPLTIATEKVEGAMSSEDIQVLNTGLFMVLPPETNSSGRLVMFHDRSRLTSPELCNGPKRLRCLFYILSCIAESQTARRLGFDAIAVYTDKTRHQTLDRQLIADMTSLVTNEILPIRHIVSHMVVLSQRPLLRNAVPLTLHILQKLNFLDRTKLHIYTSNEQSPEQILQELVEQHGFQAEGIPKSPLGGGFTVGCFRLWIEDRQRLELQRYAPYLHTPNAATAIASTIAPATTTAFTFETSQQQVDDDDEDEEKVRKRRETDAALARKKRARKQSAVKDMQDQVEFLRQQNQILHQANDEMESLLKEAHDIVKNHPDAMNSESTKRIDRIGDKTATTTTGQSSGQSRTRCHEEEAVPVSQSWLNHGLLQHQKEQEPSQNSFASLQLHGLVPSSLDSISDPSLLMPNPLMTTDIQQQPRIMDPEHHRPQQQQHQQQQQQQQQQHHQQQQQQHVLDPIQLSGMAPWQLSPPTAAGECFHRQNYASEKNAAGNQFFAIHHSSSSLMLPPATSTNQPTATTISNALRNQNPISSCIEPPSNPSRPFPHDHSRSVEERQQQTQVASAVTAPAFSNHHLYQGHVLPDVPNANPMFSSYLDDSNRVAFPDNYSLAQFSAARVYLNPNNDRVLPFSAEDVPEPTPILVVTGGNSPPPAASFDSAALSTLLQQNHPPNFSIQQQMLLHSHSQQSQMPPLPPPPPPPPAASPTTLQEHGYPLLVARGHGAPVSEAGGHASLEIIQQVQRQQQEQQQGQQREELPEQEEEASFFHQLYEFLRNF